MYSAFRLEKALCQGNTLASNWVISMLSKFRGDAGAPNNMQPGITEPWAEFEAAGIGLACPGSSWVSSVMHETACSAFPALLLESPAHTDALKF